MTGAVKRAAPRLAVALGLALSGCGGGGGGVAATPTGLRLQREDLIAVAHALDATQAQVDREVAATKAAWPSVANGLPANVAAVPAPLIRAAAREAGGMHVPALFQERDAAGLTGPASGIAGGFRSFTSLAGHGWPMIAGALAQAERGGSEARFARANVALYIDSVYDGHFGLAQIGKHMLSAYRKLGGPNAFGSALTQAQVDRLASAYSEAHYRLYPHPGVKLGS